MKKSFVRIFMLALLSCALSSRARVFGKAPETCPELVSLLAGATSDRAHALLAGVDGAHIPGASKDFGAGIQVFIERFIESARDAGLSRAHLIELLAKPLEGRIREIQEDAGTTTKSASIRSLNEVLVAVQTQLVSGEKFAEARGHFIEAFPRAISAYLGTIGRAADGARTAVDESRELEQVRVIRVGSPVYAIAVSPDGRLIASGSDDGVIRVFDGKTGDLVRELPGHTGWVNSVGWSPDGKYVVSGSGVGAVRIWEVASGKENEKASVQGPVWAVSFSPDGRFVAAASTINLVQMWELPGMKQVESYNHRRYSSVYSISFSPDGRSLVAGSSDQEISLWDIRRVKQTTTLGWHSGQVRSVKFSPDGKRVVSGGDDKTVRIWDVERRTEVASLKGHTQVVNSVSYSPDGRFVVSGSSDNSVRLWNVASGTEVARFDGHASGVTSVNFSPDGQWIISTSIDGTIQIRHVPPEFLADMDQLKEVARQHELWLQELREHPLLPYSKWRRWLLKILFDLGDFR